MKIEKKYEWRQKSKKHKTAYHKAAKLLYGIEDGELFIDEDCELKPKSNSLNILEHPTMKLMVDPDNKKLQDACPAEAVEQTRFVTWLKKQGYWVCGSANGGSRNYLEAAKLKRTGVAAGFPDIFVPLPTPLYHGFFIEMKRQKGGKLSEAQVEWLNYLRQQGYFAEVAHGCDEAKELFLDYLKSYPRAA